MFHLPSRNDIDKDTSICGKKYFTEEVKQSLGNQKYFTETAKTKKKEPLLKHIDIKTTYLQTITKSITIYALRINQLFVSP